MSKGEIGPTSSFEEAPAEMCEGIVYPVDDYLEMQSWLEKAREKCTRKK